MATWKEIIAANPDHSENYAQRWRNFVQQGKDIDGEARLIDALSARHSRILDAGCGTGRLGGYLAKRGHIVFGVDIDPVIIGYAQQDFPEATWVVGDLSADPIEFRDIDIAVSAGNVMGFLAVDGRRPALENIFRTLRPGGRFVVGFGRGRGWEFDDFLTMCHEVGFQPQHQFASWDLEPFTEQSGFLVAVLQKPKVDEQAVRSLTNLL